MVFKFTCLALPTSSSGLPQAFINSSQLKSICKAQQVGRMQDYPE